MLACCAGAGAVKPSPVNATAANSGTPSLDAMNILPIPFDCIWISVAISTARHDVFLASVRQRSQQIRCVIELHKSVYADVLYIDTARPNPSGTGPVVAYSGHPRARHCLAAATQ